MKNALIVCGERRADQFYDAVRSMHHYDNTEFAYDFSQGCNALTKARAPEDHLSLVVIQPELELSSEEIARGLRLIKHDNYSQFLREATLAKRCAGVSLVGLVGVGAGIVVDASGLSQTEVPSIEKCLKESGHIYELIKPGELNSLQEMVKRATPELKRKVELALR
ncbi:MAG: hypothetical protein NTX24_01610 [Candidatus Pacearchaeota archaeon]|nr:hypothetical protein [Candidatus Pacearchaeota archaeon]